MDVFDDDHLLARTRRLSEVEVHDLALFGWFDLLDLVECLDPALHLRGLGGLRLEAVDEALLLGEHRLLPRVGGFLVRFSNLALALVEVVVAGIDRDLAAVDLGDLADDTAHEIAVARRCARAALIVLRKSSSQMIDSMSRWFVGSSISSTSGRPSSTRAMATASSIHPESAPTSPSIWSSAKPSPCSTSRAWLSSA